MLLAELELVATISLTCIPIKQPTMKNILFTLALLICFNLFSQSNSELISKFNNDLFLSYQYILEGDYDNALDLMNPDIFNFVSKEQLIQSFEIMSGKTDIGIKITTDKPYVTKISERFDFGGYKYYRIFKKSSMEMQIINEDFLLKHGATKKTGDKAAFEQRKARNDKFFGKDLE